jgi:threonine aldolase
MLKKFFSATAAKAIPKLNTDIPNFNSHYIEMRSDVKTLPTKKMIERMGSFNFGDENIEEDPTVNKLSQLLCDMFGKEKALFVNSGTQGNMVGLGIHCERDDYNIQGERSHLQKAELAPQIHNGFRPLTSSDLDNNNLAFSVDEFLRPKGIQKKQVKAVCFENTHNYNGGQLLNSDLLKKVKSECPEIKMHLDGSRIWNAHISTGRSLSSLVSGFDTVNICFSKGLGCPIGSAVLMSEKDYARARAVRKNLGGTLRQTGFIAAPVLVALEDWKERMTVSHDCAKQLYNGLKGIKGLKPKLPESSIVNIYLDEHLLKRINEIVGHLEVNYKTLVLSYDGNSYIRAVLHHQVTKEMVDKAIDAFGKTIEQFNK